MFVELVDQLRCPVPHEETWLVLFADESRDRHVVSGTLGCPVCGARYAVDGGTAWFVDPTERAAPAESPPAAPDGAEWPVRIAAFLGLEHARGAVGLYGAWAAHAEALGDVVEGVSILAIAPTAPTHPMLSAIQPASRARIPLATASLAAAAVDAGPDAAAAVHEAARLVRSGGRLLAPADAPVPPGIEVLARDADWWVGQRDTAPAGVVSIASRRRASTP